MAANKAAIYDQDIVRAQAKAIATRRIMGNSVKSIAAEFQMDPDTVKSRLDWAKRHGLIETALDTVINQLVPEALKTMLLAIQGGDVDASRDVLFGTGVLQKNPKAGQAPQQTVELTIEAYRNERTARLSTSLPILEAPASLPASPQRATGESEPFAFDLPALTAHLDEDDCEDSGASGD